MSNAIVINKPITIIQAKKIATHWGFKRLPNMGRQLVHVQPGKPYHLAILANTSLSSNSHWLRLVCE